MEFDTQPHQGAEAKPLAAPTISASTHEPSTPDMASNLIIVMVGLPAREKSFIVKKLARYLNWLQHPTRIFNAGELRRKSAPTSVDDTSGAAKNASQSSAAFFDPHNNENVRRRDEIALQVLDHLLGWIVQRSGSVGILDATNSTRQRRSLVLSKIRRRIGPHLRILFLESCCYDEAILERNFRLKLSGPDYKSQDPVKALSDFKRRVELYEQAYVTLGEAEEDEGLSFVQVIDVGRKMNTHLIRGFLSTQVVEYMLGFNLTERQLWISCGESEDDAVGRIGRPSDLSEFGKRYAGSLAALIEQQRSLWESSRFARVQANLKSGGDTKLPSARHSSQATPFCIWTSMMPQATQTAHRFSNDSYIKTEIKMLNDINAGDMAGMTFSEIEEQFPDIYAARKQHKLLYRWPGLGGESYADVIHRMKPVILELERMREHVLLISHRAVIRVLLAYFLDLRRMDLPEIVIPKNWAFVLEPKPYGIDFRAYAYEEQSNTFTEVQDAKQHFMAP